MKLGRWIPMGSLILLMCAHQGESTLILGSMLMAATAAMTGGLIMGPLTVGGLIMMMMMAANNQNAQQRQTQSASTTSNIASTLESSQNLLNLLATLTSGASNLATSSSNQQHTTLIAPTNQPKASKRALYSPQNLHELLAESSRNTALRRQWEMRTTTTTTRAPVHVKSRHNDFWNSKPGGTTYFSPDTGFAVEPIPDDLLDIAMRLPQAKSANMFSELFDDGTVSPSSTGSGSSDFDSMMSGPSAIPFHEQKLRWVDSEPGDLFSSFPQIKEEDILNLVRKRATRETLSSKFRLEDIANVTYANDKDPLIKQQLNEREKEEDVNNRIFRQLSALDPFRCLPQLACNMQAAPPSQQTGILNDYAYLVKTVFERDEDDEEDDKKPGSSSVTKQANGNSGSTSANVAAGILSAITSAGGSKRKKKLDYKSPAKPDGAQAKATKGSSKTKSGKEDETEDDKNDDDDDDDDDGFSSEEIPMDEEELDRLLLKEQYEMEQAANEELLNDDPDLLPFVLKSASKGPSYLGSDKRNPAAAASPAGGPTGLNPQSDLNGGGPSSMMGGQSGPSNSHHGHNAPRPGPSGFGGAGGRMPVGPGGYAGVNRRNGPPYPGPSGFGRNEPRAPEAPSPPVYAQPSPLFSPSKLAKYRQEDLDNMSSRELNNLLRQVSIPGEEVYVDDGVYSDKATLIDVLGGILPTLPMPQVAVALTRRRTHTGNMAFDDDPFFDDFDFRRRSMSFDSRSRQHQQQSSAQPKLRKVRRVVRRVKESGPAARVVYLKRMKRMLESTKDPAKVFKMATQVGAKIKSSRQCRFLFNTCPLNSTQLLGMIGNIRKAVMGLSNAQQLLSGNVNLAALAQQQVTKDFEGNLATLGPNVVSLQPGSTTSATTTTPATPAVHQLTPMAQMQLVQPVLGTPQHQLHPQYVHTPLSPMSPMQAQQMMAHHSQGHNQGHHQAQNTIIVPQIVQVPQSPPPQAPQAPIIIQQQAPPPPPQMSQMQQMQQMQMQQMQQNQQQQQQRPNYHSHPVFNVISSDKATQNGMTSISHELPSGEKVEISMKLTGEAAAAKTKKKPAIPVSAPRPPQPPQQKPSTQQSQSRPGASAQFVNLKVKKPSTSVQDLVDLFDDDNADNFLLPTKTLIETEIKEPGQLDSLQAAIMAIEKINQAAEKKKKSNRPSFLEDDENEEYKFNAKLAEALKKPSTAVPAKKTVPAGLRLPNKKKPSEQDDVDEEETEEDDDEDEDEEEDDDQYRYRSRLPDPMDPKRRHFIPVPDKEVQFQEASELTVPATQTFVKKRLQLQESAAVSSSEEDDEQQQHREPSQRRSFTISRRKIRRPRILYPQEDIEKPTFIPL